MCVHLVHTYSGDVNLCKHTGNTGDYSYWAFWVRVRLGIWLESALG